MTRLAVQGAGRGQRAGGHVSPAALPAARVRTGAVLVSDDSAVGVRVDPELPADPQGPVTTTVTRRIKPGQAASEAFLAGISGAARAFPGYLDRPG